MDVKEEEILGTQIHRHWYYISKGRTLLKFLGHLNIQSVLDVGAGSGFFARLLLKQTATQKATCVDPAYPEDYDILQNHKPISFRRNIESQDQDLILMMDVLEHVEDDVGLLKEYTDHMPVGGYVLITVPAFQFLWSGHDVFLEHYRRYTLANVESVVSQANLKIIKTRYFFGILFPLIILIRFYGKLKTKVQGLEAKSDLKPAHPLVNTILVRIHDLERLLFLPLNKIAGLSVFCLAQRV